MAISIHALRVEGDSEQPVDAPDEYDFYPRPPCGGRQKAVRQSPLAILFLSTPSVWRATCSVPSEAFR